MGIKQTSELSVYRELFATHSPSHLSDEWKLLLTVVSHDECRTTTQLTLSRTGLSMVELRIYYLLEDPGCFLLFHTKKIKGRWCEG
jgi:hypothetical protein